MVGVTWGVQGGESVVTEVVLVGPSTSVTPASRRVFGGPCPTRTQTSLVVEPGPVHQTVVQSWGPLLHGRRHVDETATP